MTLTWSEATADDRPTLEHFCCANPVERKWDRYRRMKYHPRPWELRIQSHVRTMGVPTSLTEHALLGVDESAELAAVAHFGLDTKRTTYIIWTIARSGSCRGRGYGEEALGTALDVMTTEAEADRVMTRIDPRNTLSKGLAHARGFVHYRTEDGFEEWGRRLP